MGLVGFKSNVNPFALATAARFLFVYYRFPCLLFLPVCWCCGAVVFGLIGCQSRSPGLALPIFLKIIIIIIMLRVYRLSELNRIQMCLTICLAHNVASHTHTNIYIYIQICLLKYIYIYI